MRNVLHAVREETKEGVIVPNVLATEQVQFFEAEGYLHIPGVFSVMQTARLTDELDWQIGTWAEPSPGWLGG